MIYVNIGSRRHAASENLLNKYGITHILNVTEIVPCYYPEKIKYARIKVLDVNEVPLRNYFKVAHEFIDLCNPNINNNNDNDKPCKILVHCAMGISRSASIIISYLMNRNIIIDDLYQLTIINECIIKLNEYTLQYNKHKKRNENEDIMKKYDDETKNTKYIGMDLGLAYAYVKRKRDIICPNIGFLKELEIFEKEIHGKTTLFMLPIYKIKFDETKNTSCLGNCIIL